jgi:hypothetical protein
MNMATITMTLAPIVGAFSRRADAEMALRELHREVFMADQLGILTRGRPAERLTTDEANADLNADQIGKDAATGAITGGGIGALAGLALTAGIIPGVGPVLAGGILMGMLGAAAAGSILGGVAGTLIGIGMPKEKARKYESEWQAGATLVTVRTEDRRSEAAAILRRYGARSVEIDEPVAV